MSQQSEDKDQEQFTSLFKSLGHRTLCKSKLRPSGSIFNEYEKLKSLIILILITIISFLTRIFKIKEFKYQRCLIMVIFIL